MKRIFVEDARIYMDTGNFFLGQTLKAEFHQTYKKKISIKAASLVIKAVSFDTGKKGGSPIEYPHLTRQYKVLKDRTVDKGGALELIQKLKIPSAKKPTPLPDQKGYPRYQWRFEINVRFHKLPESRIKFPIVVEESGGREN